MFTHNFFSLFYLRPNMVFFGHFGTSRSVNTYIHTYIVNDLPNTINMLTLLFAARLQGGLVVAALQAADSPCTRAIDCCSPAHAKSLHTLWPIRAPTFRLRQSERDLPAAPIRTPCAVVTPNRPKANSRTFRRVTLKHARLTQQHVKGCIFCNTSLRPHYLSLAIVPISLWD